MAKRVAKNVNVLHEESLTIGQRTADALARFAGSWTFIGIFTLTIVVWIMLNTYLVIIKRFDPFPFILLNLALSCLAAIQAPIILMSQNRQEVRDRIRADNDYSVNVKAELEIAALHAKIDRLLDSLSPSGRVGGEDTDG